MPIFTRWANGQRAKLQIGSTAYWITHPQIVNDHSLKIFEVMARKRKIPARKHHGVRDPLRQLEQKEKKLKNVINNPPVRGSDQKASFKFTQFKKLADDTKSGKKLKRIHSGQEDKPVNSKLPSANKIRNIKQLNDETDRAYLKRVNRITTESLKEAQYEAKYGVTVVRNPKTGEITLKKKPKNEIDELLKQKQKERINNKTNKKPAKVKQAAKPIDPREARELIKQAMKDLKEENKTKPTEIEEYKRDVIKFGETVHGPPTLTVPRRAVKCETVPRPGKKSSLLLKSLLSDRLENKATPKTVKKVGNKASVKKGTVMKPDLKGKRKDLPAATRKMLETEQSAFVEMYRNLKKAKEKKQIT